MWMVDVHVPLSPGVDHERGGSPREAAGGVHFQAVDHGRGVGAEGAAAQAGERTSSFQRDQSSLEHASTVSVVVSS